MHGLGNLRRLLRPLRLIVKSPGAEPAEEKEEKRDGRAPGSRKVLSGPVSSPLLPGSFIHVLGPSFLTAEDAPPPPTSHPKLASVSAPHMSAVI